MTEPTFEELERELEQIVARLEQGQVPLDEAPGQSRDEFAEGDVGHREFGVHQHGLEDERLTGSVDRIALDRAINELPAGYRAVFVLHDVEGFTHGEIGSMLGIPEGTARSDLHHARTALRRLLKDVRSDT